MRSIRRMVCFPDQPQFISDNATVAAIARDLGLLDKLVGASGLAHAVTGLFHRRHRTHWLLFGLVTGMADSTENGLTLGALPKSQFSEAQARALFDQMIDSTQPESRKDA